MLEKLKSWIADDTLYVALLLILVAGSSFGLGRLSIEDSATAPVSPAESHIQLLTVSSTPTVLTSPVPTQSGAAVVKAFAASELPTGPYVASKSGTKYHLVTCGSAKQIKSENKIFFATKNEAEAAGYTPASNCPGI